MAPLFPRVTGDHHPDAELYQMRYALNQAADICNEFFAFEGCRAEDDPRLPRAHSAQRGDALPDIPPRPTSLTDHPANAQHQKMRQDLYREEARIATAIRNHFSERINNPNTPEPTEGLLGNDMQKSMQQGPELTTEDYAVISKGFQDRLKRDVDRFATSNGILGADWRAHTGGLHEECVEIMVDFYLEYGPPNVAETLMLAELLRYPTNAVTWFFARIVQNAADARRGEKLVANKVFQLRLKEYGMLEAMQTYTRNQAAAQHIADMD
ncbi:unnamed protein product [Zymoseptoria tritici ST99CH_1A5]|uniref:Uncharacterized protein n=1 Tax=Zymoseptoria tritici ST99CH_1A5 TaxID=1276529 RepID=A0A1Y6LZW7_ZYMTR|nr:unnamed protein product [Zymoseptoria tritici ST99CH_3D1]SMY29872.1 unnamed protein product [Zymoseptoria tritici ST99CH_1A5]